MSRRHTPLQYSLLALSSPRPRQRIRRRGQRAQRHNVYGRRAGQKAVSPCAVEQASDQTEEHPDSAEAISILWQLRLSLAPASSPLHSAQDTHPQRPVASPPAHRVRYAVQSPHLPKLKPHNHLPRLSIPAGASPSQPPSHFSYSFSAAVAVSFSLSHLRSPHLDIVAFWFVV